MRNLGSSTMWLALAAALTLPCLASAQGAADEPAAATSQLSPAVEAVLELPRTEPGHYFAAIVNLIDLGEPALAKPILEELTSQNLTEKQRAQLVEQFGSAQFMKLARIELLAPAGREFADACLAAAAARARDPQRLAELVNQLTSQSAQTRHTTLVDLKAAGQDGAVALLVALAGEKDPQRRAAIATAVVGMGSDAVGPLLGMLWTNDTALKADVIRLLTALDVHQAFPLIAATVATDAKSSEEAERLLLAAIHNSTSGEPVFLPDADNHVILWTWDGAKLASLKLTEEAAKKTWAARLAIVLSNLRPDNVAYRQQAILLGLEAGASPRDSLGNPLRAVSPFEDLRTTDNLVQQADAQMINAVLADALERRYVRAATAAAHELLSRADYNVLYSAAPKPAPLVKALSDPNRNIRFAALRTVLELKPQSPFPGSSNVAKALAYFVGSADQRAGLVAMPNLVRAADLAGQLQSLGFETQATNEGRELVLLARQAAGLDLILVDMNILDPGIREVVYELRASTAAGTVPLGLLAADGRLDEAKRLADEHQRIVAWSRPHRGEDLVALVNTLAEMSVKDDEKTMSRSDQAVQSLQWMAQLLNNGPAFYDVQPRAVETARIAVYQSQRTEAALAVLTAAGTPASQNAMLDFAGQRTLPVESRRQAAEAFQENVRRFGLLLTTDEILRQYDRYNASASADAETQQILGQLIDTIESQRTQSVSTERLP